MIEMGFAALNPSYKLRRNRAFNKARRRQCRVIARNPADALDAERQSVAVGEAGHVDAGCSHQGPQPVERRRTEKIEAFWGCACRGWREQNIKLGGELVQSLTRALGDAAGSIIGVGRDRGGLVEQVAQAWGQLL